MRIGIVKLSSIGDVVHTLPLAAALRRDVPGAWVAWVAEEREAALLDAHPDLDAVVRVDTRGWRRRVRRLSGLGPALREVARARRALRALQLDVAIDAQGLVKSGAIVQATGAPVRIGFAVARCRERASALFTNRRVSPGRQAGHVVDQYLTLLDPLGVEPGAPVFRVPEWPAAERRVAGWLAGLGLEPGDRVVVLCPGAGRPDKRWPAAAFRALAAGLRAEPGAAVVVAWGPGERGPADKIAAGLDPGVAVAPATDLHELAALLRRASLVVGGDTGPLHLAAALGTACLGLFGPTPAARNGPYGARSRTLQSTDRTMGGLEPAAVLRAARELLDAA
jgi:lipopolysaccharide heptosyltransferase I